MKNLYETGYKTGVSGMALILLWLGLFKFTPTEAAGIQPLIENHFAFSWLYNVMSVQVVSNLFGVAEMAVGALLFISLFRPQTGKIAGVASALIFVTTISFLFTTPGTWKIVDGFLVTDFFLIKDIPYLAFSLMVIARSQTKSTLDQTGYKIAVCGTALILLWLGFGKFTPTQAEGISFMVGNHFALSWLYDVTSVYTAAKFFGGPEMIIGILLIVSLFKPRIGKIPGAVAIGIFMTTISFLFTTPGTWKVIDGILITDFFLFKDISYLAVSIMVFAKSQTKEQIPLQEQYNT